ncbi:MAG: lipid-A-disaccharide synthase [Desulfovibrionaceae bacterium]
MTKPQAKGPGRRVWISAGEASGDMHGALLARALLERDPGLSLHGMGGAAMREAGVEVELPFELISLVGLVEVVSALPRVLRTLKRTKARLRELLPEAIVFIDCPDYHFRLIRFAAGLGIPVYYYISPQIWAWRSGRAKFLSRYVRKVLCILPFEEEFYARFGLEADYVGNPLMDQIPLGELDELDHEPGRVGILPGSRGREVATLLPVFASAARLIRERLPEARFSLIRAPGVREERLRGLWPADLPVDIHPPEERYTALKRCELALAASGTVTLEAALIGTPTILSYQLSKLSYALSKLVINVRFAGLPNLIMDREIFPEMIQEKSNPADIAAMALTWMTDKAASDAVRHDIRKLWDAVGEPGAADRAAEIILADLTGGKRP